jgi:hypothetical protein
MTVAVTIKFPAPRYPPHQAAFRAGFSATADVKMGAFGIRGRMRASGIPYRTEISCAAFDRTRRNGMARRSPPRKVTYFEPVVPRLARNTIIESTFEVGRSFRCTMRVDCGRLDPGG